MFYGCTMFYGFYAYILGIGISNITFMHCWNGDLGSEQMININLWVDHEFNSSIRDIVWYSG